MSTDIKKALIYGAAIIMATCVWSLSDSLHARQYRYEISSAGTLGLTFLLDRQSGAVWRYYRNIEKDAKFSDEGFMLVRQPDTATPVAPIP